MSLETKSISKIRFGLLSPEEIRNSSVVEVISEDTFANGVPVDGGLFDLRMGTIEQSERCATCRQFPQGCPGHFGHLELASPIFHPFYLDVIKKVLECVCFFCSELMITEPQISYARALKKNNRLDYVKNAVKSRRNCPSCTMLQPTIKRQKGVLKLTYEIRTTESDSKLNTLTPNLTMEILKRMSNYTAETIGFGLENRPEWMIFQVIPISPPSMRPTVTTDSNQRGEDDLTVFLTYIIRSNKTLKDKINSPSTNDTHLLAFIENLNFMFATMIVGGAKKGAKTNLGSRFLVTRTGKPLKALSERTSGKHGRIRKNLMGKRVNFSARSVISPDPNLDIDQLGVPKKVAEILTVPVIVNDYNRDEISRFIANREHKHPGAISIVQDGQIRTLKFIQNVEDIVLKTGDIVIRQLMDGDVVLFNRQPTLHKMSMMAFKTKIMEKGKTFRINLSVTTPFNADFDGDEMNAHIPQSITTSNELWELARVSTQIVTPQTNGPIIGIVQDSLLGSYLMTLTSTKINKVQAMNILVHNPLFDGNMPESIEGGEYWSGRQLVTTILPAINIQKFSNTYKEGSKNTSKNYLLDSKIVIKNGIMESGTLDKSIIGAKKEGSIAHVIFNDYNSERAKNFLNLIQRYTNQFLIHRGFSVGLGDAVPSKDLRKRIDKKILESMSEIQEILDRIENNTYIPPVDMTVEEYLEVEAIEKLNSLVLNVGSEALESLSPETNALVAMITSGSKGEKLNVGQIMGSVGQQNVDRQRIGQLYGMNRTLPQFQKYDVTPEARGFVQHSFIQGLTPYEFFFHAMTGREGIIDTAIRTADSGYISRRLMKAMEDIKVWYDNSIRNANGQIVQYPYGEDGIDPMKIEKQKFDVMFMSNKEIRAKYSFANKNEAKQFLSSKIVDEIFSEAGKKILDKEVDDIILDRDFIRSNASLYSTNPDDKLFLPCNIRRLIVNAMNQFNIISDETVKPKTKSQLNPLNIVNAVNSLIEKLPKLFANQLNENLKLSEIYYYAVRNMRALIRANLGSKRVIVEYKLNQAAFDYIINEIERKFLDAIVQPGELVGAVSSQSLGEPSTQLTLNTFHFSGVGQKSNITAGVPRLRELIDVARKLKNPFLIIYLKDEYKQNQTIVEALRNDIKDTRLNEFVNKVQIIYDPNPEKPQVEEDKKIVDDFFKYTLNPKQIPVVSNWVLRLTLDRTKVLYNQMRMSIIRNKLEENQEFYVITSDDNAKHLIVRIHFVINHMPIKEQNNAEQIVKYKDRILEDISLRGIPGITRVQVREDKNVKRFDPETGEVISDFEYYLDTDGSNLEQILKRPEVDPRRTISTDVTEVNKVFGIDAARKVLLNEIRQVLTFNGSYVNYHHLALLADVMTQAGYLTAISRHGFNRLDKSPISKTSFEETSEQLKNAALYAEFDNMKSVSAKIMFAQAIEGGTGLPQISIDESMYGVSGNVIDEIMGI